MQGIPTNHVNPIRSDYAGPARSAIKKIEQKMDVVSIFYPITVYTLLRARTHIALFSCGIGKRLATTGSRGASGSATRSDSALAEEAVLLAVLPVGPRSSSSSGTR